MQVILNETQLVEEFGGLGPLPAESEYPVIATVSEGKTADRLEYISLETIMASPLFSKANEMITRRRSEHVWDADKAGQLHSGGRHGIERAETLVDAKRLYIHASTTLISSSFFLGLMSKYEKIVLLPDSNLITEQELVRAFRRASTMSLPIKEIEIERTGFTSEVI